MSSALSFSVLALLFWLSLAGAGRAQLPAELPEGLPFDRHELNEALSARIPTLSPEQLRLAWLDGRVLVTVGTRARLVELGDAEHAEAARVVALVVADLASEEAPPPPQVAPTPVPPPVRTIVVVQASAPRPTAPIASDHARLGVDIAGQRGLAGEEPWSVDAGIVASGLLWRRFVLAGRVGYMTVPSQRSAATGTAVRLDALSLRPALGVRLQLLELLVGPTLIPYWVHGGAGHQSVLPGASAQLTLWLPVVRSLRIAARLCFDVLGNRTRVYAGSDRVLTTPRTMLGLSLGFAWGWT